MKIGITLLTLTRGKMGGMEHFIRNWVIYLSKLENIEVYVFVSDHTREYFSDYPDIKCIYLKKRWVDENYVHEEIDYFKIDIFINPFLHQEIYNLTIPSVTVFPDVQNFEHPANFDEETLYLRNKNFYSAEQNSELILTISEFSKQRIMEYSSLNAEEIDYIYLAADEVFYQEQTDQKSKEVKMKFGLPDKYIYYPANTWPHKNHKNLLRAFKKLLNQNKLEDVKLVFTGVKESNSDAILQEVSDSRISDKVVFLGYLDQADMPNLYKNALFLINPSTYEGFGIPIVEAMISECAVTCSNITSFPEIAGDAAHYFDPYDIDSIAMAMDEMMDENLRKAYIKKGLMRNKAFSWEKSAKKSVDIFEEIIKKADEYKPLVSVVTPSYNQGEFIEETILSVLNQSYKNIEYIVMDGGSTDETVDILKKYDGQITWVSESDEGQAHAVDKGIRVAKGEIIGWLNSDDTYELDAIERIVKRFGKRYSGNIYYGEANYIDREGNVTGRYNTKPYQKDTLIKECYLCQPATFFTKDFYIRVGGLNISRQMCMDYDLWIRMSKLEDLVYIPDLLATSRLYAENKTLGQTDKVYNEIFKTIKVNYGYLPRVWVYRYYLYLIQNGKITKRAYRIKEFGTILRYNINKPREVILTIRDYTKKVIISILNLLKKLKRRSN